MSRNVCVAQVVVRDAKENCDGENVCLFVVSLDGLSETGSTDSSLRLFII